MKMNRRNALIGLGAIATGGGALFGSGAFSTVEANRSVKLTSTGDASAYLQMTVSNGSVASTASDGEIVIGGSSFNVNATTVFDTAITIKNTGSNAVNVASTSITSGTNFSTVKLKAFSGPNNDIGDTVLSDTAVDLAAGGDVVVGIVAKAADSTTGTDDNTITIEASDDTTYNTTEIENNVTGTTASQET
jgi:hypothetical protein